MTEQLAFLDKGSGEKVVLLHGFCESKEIWNLLLPALSQRYHVLAPDLPGFGENHPINAQVSIESMAMQIAAWMQQHAVDECHLVGHSMGGYAALALADKYPEMVKGLCLLHSTARADSDEKQQNRNKTVEFLEKNGVETFVKNFIPTLFAPSRQKNLQTIIQEVIQLAAKTPLTSAVAATQAMRDRSEKLDILRKAEYPIYLIAGKEDSLVPYHDLQEQAKIGANTKLIGLENCGHMAMYEKTEECTNAILNFLQQ